MSEEKNSIKTIVLFAVFLSSAITLIIFVISFGAWLFLQDPILFFVENTYIPRGVSIKFLFYSLFIISLFFYIFLKLRIQEKSIPKRSGIVLVILLTYLLSSISLAVFLSFTTQMIDYERIPEGNPHRQELLENRIPCYFDFKESFFDAVSGFTTTGLTAFQTEHKNIEVSKIDVQPDLIHVIRAAYLWIGGLGIMFFYLYFTPLPSLMMSMGYETPTERSLPKFIRLESFSFSMVYVVITVLGILLLFLSISSTGLVETDDGPLYGNANNKEVITYSVVLAFSSISTGGFSPDSNPVDQIEIETSYKINEKPESKTLHVNNFSLLIIMILMLAGAMPIFSLHRPLKFFRRWITVVLVFLLPIALIALLSYSEDDPEISLYRSFDAVSAFTTTGLATSQFVEDFKMPSEPGLVRERSTEIYQYPRQYIFIIVLMFVGGAAYSTAGGWGFFNLYCIIHSFYLIIIGKFERALLKYIFGLILSFLVFFSIFAIGTFFCYKSGLFGRIPDAESTSIIEYILPSAFYEISALSTVGLMPEYEPMLQNGSIYYNDTAYWTLIISMLIGRLYYIIFPFLISIFVSSEGK